MNLSGVGVQNCVEGVGLPIMGLHSSRSSHLRVPWYIEKER